MTGAYCCCAQLLSGEELIAELRQKRKERMTELFNHLTDEEAVYA